MGVLKFNAVILGLALALPCAAQPKPVPVEVWADSLQVSQLDMSPDAGRIAMLMRRERGAHPQLMVFDTADIAGTLQAIQPEGLIPQSLRWASNNHLIVNFIFQTESMGRPTYLSRSASYSVDTGEWTSLIRTTSRRDVRGTGSSLMNAMGIGRVVNVLPDDPEHVLIAHNEEQGKPPNFYRVNLEDGRRSLVLKGNTRFGDYIWDREGNARGATEYDAANIAIAFLARMSPDDDWKEIGRQRADNRDRFNLLGFYDPERPYIATILADEPGENYSGIYEVDIRSGERELVFRTTEYDAAGVITSPRLADGTRVVGYSYADHKGYQQYFIDPTYGALHKGLEQAFPDRVVRIQRVSEDGATALVYTTGPREPGRWYLFKDGQVAPIISATSEIPAEALSPVEVIQYTARDGLEVSGYVTIPAGAEGPFPTIAMPHGGPWVRDTYGYDRWAQMLANRGYAVFQPNYRGSTDLGKEFWMAGDKRWGLEMQNDIEDGLAALADRGIADPDRLAIFGWSYGGYAAYVAATRENTPFNCIVSGAGVSDLTRIRGGLSGNRFLRQYQKPTIGGVSPIERVERVTRPMLIVHGDYDSTVPVEHSRRFVQGLESSGADFQYIEIKDMGHSPIFFEQNMAWFPALLEFFDQRCSF
ncbi:MAG: prolyl oligopeptidase family serine peptidase [Wenzhouxiangellaceae bacterium]|nr:prolyl oligopeptidase family serine peptidase [Wenzhouxiangellaceae bacterium]